MCVSPGPENPLERIFSCRISALSRTFTLRVPCLDIPVKDSFLNMLSQTGIMEQPITDESRKTVQIRKKIKEIFGSDCLMNDDMVLKRYRITSDGELIVIVK